MSDVENQAWLMAEKLLARASRGGAARERLQWIVAAVLAWQEASAAMAVAGTAAEGMITGPRGRFEEAKRLFEEAQRAEGIRRAELLNLAGSLSKWLAAIPEEDPALPELHVTSGCVGIRGSELTGPVRIGKLTVSGQGSIGIDLDDD